MERRSLSTQQRDAFDWLSQWAGQRVLVLTSQYRVAEEAERISVGHANASTLRGLAARGLIQIEPIWRGAWVTVPAQDITLSR